VRIADQQTFGNSLDSQRFPCSAHEVFVDEEQLAWFEATLQRCGSRPVVVFTHVRSAAFSCPMFAAVSLLHPDVLMLSAFPLQAPPMGSGLQVVQEVRICCWPTLHSCSNHFLRVTVP
jgi:hypothetical protein